MTFFTLSRPGAPWDYATLGFLATANGAVLDGSLFTPVALTIPPDAYWSVGGSAEANITRYAQPVADALQPVPEVEDGWLLAYSDTLNTYVPTAPEDVIATDSWTDALADSSALVTQKRTLIDVETNGIAPGTAADSTNAIEALAATASAFGAGLHFGPGVWNVHQAEFTQADLYIHLHPEATIKVVASAAGSAFVLRAPRITVTGGGTIDGSPTTSTSSALIYAYEASATDLTIDGLRLISPGGGAVVITGSRARVRNNYIYSTSVEIGIRIIAITAGGDLLDCKISGNTLDLSGAPVGRTTAGIGVYGTASNVEIAQRTRVIGNTVVMPALTSGAPGAATGPAIAIEMHRGGGTGATVVGNTVSNGSMGVSISSSTGAAVSGNTIKGPSWYGVEIAESPRCTVSGNTIDGNAILGHGDGAVGTAAIVVNGAGTAADGCAISGNVVHNLWQGSLDVHGVSLESGTGHAVVGNTLNVGNRYGIQTTKDKTTIANNAIIGTASGINYAVGLRAACTGKSAVTGNYAEGFIYFLYVDPSGGVTADNITVTGNDLVTVTTATNYTTGAGGTIGTNIKHAGNIGLADAGDTSKPGALFIAGSYYGPQHGGTVGSAAMTQNELNAYPFVVSRAKGLTLQHIQLYCQTAQAGSSVRVGIYADSGGLPGALLTEFTTGTQLDTTTQGSKTLAVSYTLPPGVYWVASVTQGSATGPSVNIMSGASPLVGMSTAPNNSSPAAAYTVAGVSGALPTPFGTPAGAQYANRVMLRST